MRNILYCILLFGIYQSAYCQTKYYGSIKGQVVDDATKLPLAGCNIIVIGTQSGTTSDTLGNFELTKMPVGSYTLKFNFIGFKSLVKPDVIVKSDRITFISVDLKSIEVTIDGVTVSAGYFKESDKQPISIINFSNEEIRRGAGTGGDISRMLFSLPSISKVNESQNCLIVRGGSPSENSFYIDNIEIPNINHFPVQGSTAGHTGLLNVNLIKDVNFYTGGFSANYGDRLSSVMDISFRDGNKEEIDFQSDLNITAVGIVGEGPINNGKGSWLLSARYSYLDLVTSVFIADEETSPPRYGDVQGKIVYNFSDRSKITLLNLSAYDFFSGDKESAVEWGDNTYGSGKSFQSTIGLNWQYLWGSHGYSNFIVSHTLSRSTAKYFSTATGYNLINHLTLDQYYNLRNLNYFRLNPSNTLETGVGIKLNKSEYDNFYAENIDNLNNPISELQVKENKTSIKLDAFISYNLKLFDRFSVNPGLRIDYFDYNKNTHISPRFSFSYRLNELTTMNGGIGVYYQNLPMILLTQNQNYKSLKDPVSYHYVIGLRRFLSENTQLTIEAYYKSYDDFPLNPQQPNLFITDQVVYEEYFLNQENLESKGKAFSSGCEIMVQKKLVEDLYGTISGTYFVSRYQDYQGIWRNRAFDNRFIFNVEGGYKPNNSWEYSLRWSYGGGIPFTPFDEYKSFEAQKGILDINQINSERLPPFHSLNIRIDRRFYFARSNLIIYLDVWNVYMRKNIAKYIWNESKNKAEPYKLWTNSIIPALGVEFDF